MLAAITAGTAVCCFATAYGLHQVAPVKPITDEDEIVNKSTYGTVNLLPQGDLKTKSLQELIDAYLDKRASLDDVMMLATQTANLRDAFAAVSQKTTALPAGEEHARFLFLKKAALDHYPELRPPPEPVVLAAADAASAKAVPPQMGGGHLRFSVSIKRRSLRRQRAKPLVVLGM
jgi:hypothetical protein